MKREDIDKILHDKVEGGEKVSPILPNGIKNYLIDIDGTITDDVPNEEPERMGTCEPFYDALETCNKWYDEGHMICFFTLNDPVFLSCALRSAMFLPYVPVRSSLAHSISACRRKTRVMAVSQSKNKLPYDKYRNE